MAIRSIEIENVLAFQGRRYGQENVSQISLDQPKEKIGDGFRLDFCEGINVLIGENGVGKTSLLKMIYAAAQWSFRQTDSGRVRSFSSFFSEHLKEPQALKSSGQNEDHAFFKVSDGEHIIEYSLSRDETIRDHEWSGLNIPAIFIPTTEMLSHSRGFLAMNQKYNMPFDGTQIDIIVNASLPETRRISKTMAGVLEKLSQVIQGTVVQNDDVFYIQKEDGRKVDFSLEAEGYRKLGLLWKLVRNGLLEKGAVLLWDEPEANLNPELYPVLAETLLELQRDGVQMFIATHNYNFAKYLEIRRENSEEVLFHNLYRRSAQPEDGAFAEIANEKMIHSDSALRLDDLKFNQIMMADEKLLNEVYEMRGEA